MDGNRQPNDLTTGQPQKTGAKKVLITTESETGINKYLLIPEIGSLRIASEIETEGIEKEKETEEEIGIEIEIDYLPEFTLVLRLHWFPPPRRITTEKGNATETVTAGVAFLVTIATLTTGVIVTADHTEGEDLPLVVTTESAIIDPVDGVTLPLVLTVVPITVPVRHTMMLIFHHLEHIQHHPERRVTENGVAKSAVPIIDVNLNGDLLYRQMALERALFTSHDPYVTASASPMCCSGCGPFFSDWEKKKLSL